MTTQTEALDRLIEAVETGEWDFRADAPARQVFPYKSASADDLGLTARAAFEGSLDAAKALHEKLLPGWVITIERVNSGQWMAILRLEPRVGTVRADGGDGARAWLLAILRAYRGTLA